MSDPILYDLSWDAWHARQQARLDADLLEPSVPFGDAEQEADAREQWRHALTEGHSQEAEEEIGCFAAVGQGRWLKAAAVCFLLATLASALWFREMLPVTGLLAAVTTAAVLRSCA